MRLLVTILVALSLLGLARGRCAADRFPGSLDVGVYWAAIHDPGRGQNRSLVWARSCPELNHLSPHFHADHPSLWITHGLQPGMVQLEKQFLLDGEVDNSLMVWLMRGYNVGVFVWTQFADTEIKQFVHTEDQIYTTHGFVKMRYRVKTSPRGRIRELDAPLNMTVTDYYVHNYRFHYPTASAPGGGSGEVTMLGHSLGTQLTLNTAYQLHLDPTINNKPTRIALLDAIMSPSRKIYFERSECGPTISLNMGCMARFLNIDRGVAIEYYKSSFINRCIFSSREDKDLIEYTAYTVVKMNTWGMHPMGSCWDKLLLRHIKDIKSYVHALAYQMNWQHIFIIPYYLMSLFMPPHRCLISKDARTCSHLSTLALSAAMPTADVLTWSRPPSAPGSATNVTSKLCFHQFDECLHNRSRRHDATASTMTLATADDHFYLKYCASANT